MKVRAMTGRTGRPVANQVVLEDTHVIPVKIDGKRGRISAGDVFQSYDSLVAIIDWRGSKYVDHRYYKYSKTTSKYLSQFFGMAPKEIEMGIKTCGIQLCEIEQ